MYSEKFDKVLIEKIISIHDEYLEEIPSNRKDLYESEDSVMWDGYIKPILELNNTIDSAFRFNSNILEVNISEAYKPGGIENLDLPQLGFVFRDILVNEKYHLGLFADLIMDGRISRLVSRLKYLVTL